MIEPWNEEERARAFAVFNKIENNNREWLSARRANKVPSSYPMPHDLFNAHRRTLKNISSEICVFDTQNRIFLTMRPTKDELPAEPYPGVWHIPGTRHVANETNAEALERLLESEIGIQFETNFVDCIEYPEGDSEGILFLYTAKDLTDSIDTDEARQWFDVNALPKPVLKEHMTIIKDILEKKVV